MQAPNAQGIMGLMSQGRAPQGAPQQQMPSPMKASPMAGLGSVEDRVAAYRGNPAPLQQRYQMSQDLLDLLALQKIKSEKEAATRQMQLSMNQQQAAQGMEPQTIAQQREKEVHDMTKAELAQQRGETAGHQMEQQQDAMKRAMSGGLAAAPGAAIAAQPKAMATGGIVAFPTGGDVPMADAQEQNPDVDEDGNPRPRSERERILQQNERIRTMKANAQALGEMRDRRMAGVPAGLPERMAEFYKPRRPDVTSAAQAVTTQGAAPAPAPAAPTPPAPGAPQAGPQVPPPVAPTAPAAPRPAPAPGIAGLPAVAKPAGLESSMQADYSRDPNAEREAAEKRIREAYALTPEQKAVFEQGIAQRQKMFDETYDPKRQREQSLIKFLTGAGGRRYGELAAGSEASGAYEEAQRQAKLKDFGEMQKAREGLVGLEREGIKPSIEGGLKALEQTRLGRSDAQKSAQALYGTDVHARDQELNRRVEMMKAQISAETNRIQREGLDLSRASAALTNAERLVATEIRKIDEGMQKDPRIGMLMMKGADKLSPAEKAELETAQLRAEQAKRAIQKSMEPVIASARSKLGVTGSSMSKDDQALVDKYLKGK